MGTSVASALTAETIFEIIKCISDVDMRGRGRMGTKSEIFRFFNSGYAHDRNISIFRRRASRVTGNTLIMPRVETCFVAHYYACAFGLNRLRIDGDIRQKAAITAIMENVVIAIYRLRPIQKYQKSLRITL